MSAKPVPSAAGQPTHDTAATDFESVRQAAEQSLEAPVGEHAILVNPHVALTLVAQAGRAHKLEEALAVAPQA